MVILGIDYGSAKVGLAIAEGLVAVPLRVVKYDNQRELREAIRAACAEYAVSTIVVGMPHAMRGNDTAQTADVVTFVAWLRREMSTPVVTEDERLTTAFAKQLASQWNGKADDDAIAATLILQSYIERNPS